MRGSKHYAREPLRPLESTVAMVNLEMLGRPGDENDPPVWVTGSEHSDLIDWLDAANEGHGVRFVDGREIGPEEGDAYDRSDNYPLAQRGVVAHSVSLGAIDEHYHAPHDEADTLDYEAMTVVVQGIARGVYRLAEHDERPRAR